MPIERYHRPSDLSEAWTLLRDGGEQARLLGGGTDLVVSCPPQVRELIDLAGVGLAGVQVEPTPVEGTSAEGPVEGRALRIGAMTTFTELLEHPAVAAHATGVLPEMLVHVGSVLHRNSATIGGHLARARMSDVIGVLLALDASVTVFTGGPADAAHPGRELPLVDYLAGFDGPHVLTEVRLPALPDGSGPAGSGPAGSDQHHHDQHHSDQHRPGLASAAAFTRFARSAYDIATLTCCGRIDIDGDRVVAARLTLSEPAIVGRRIPAGEEVLLGATLADLRDGDVVERAATAVTDHVEVQADWMTSAEYRRHLGGVAVRRVLTTVVERLDP